MSKTTVNTEDSRVNVLIRLVGILVFVLGAGMTYETYANSAGSALQPPLVPVLYLLSVMLLLAGLVAIIAKYKPSSTKS
ncbi:MAG: hypothetical protein JRN23_05365 [Nitrososphaerota archaeon]|jgi:uncharacterized membrane protein YoaK (UPF0700 family)|nr:hypothetical protein [Nitrososphaerota archaeon]MDG6966428.1 hypothetical protein [Nitrososphaerota archaeon]MDG6979120.1 hypothetical protein [Nitrososphaerota archaeon]MDG7021338.1 hypothetical protein [Nitrososphaerota archaeon]